MRIELEKRPERAEIFAWASPLIAVALTVVTGGLIFALAGINPLKGLYVFFIEPFTSLWSIEELIGEHLKRHPEVLSIGVIQAGDYPSAMEACEASSNTMATS